MIQSRPLRLGRALLGAICVAALLLVSLGATPGHAAGGGTPAQVAKRELLQLTSSPPTLTGGFKIKGPIPRNETVAIMNCGDPECTGFTVSAVQAAHDLGWKTKVYNMGLDPTTITPSWNEVVAAHVSGVLTNGVPEVEYTNQAKALKKQRVPIVEGNTTLSGPDPALGIIGVFSGKQFDVNVGRETAIGAIAFGGNHANILFVGSSAFASLNFVQHAFTSDVASACPSCKVSVLNVAASDVADGLAVSKVVADLQAHPEVGMVIGVDNLMPGLRNALDSAGLGTVLIGATGGSPEALADVAAGTQSFTSVGPNVENGYTGIDGLARAFVGMPVQPQLNLSPPVVMLTQANIKKYPYKTGVFAFVPRYKNYYWRLWGLKKS